MMRPGLSESPYVGLRLNETVLYAFFFVAGTGLSIVALPTTSAALSVAWWGAVLIVVRSDLRTLTIPDGASLAIAVLGTTHAYLRSDIAANPWSDAIEALLRGVLAF